MRSKIGAPKLIVQTRENKRKYESGTYSPLNFIFLRFEHFFGPFSYKTGWLKNVLAPFIFTCVFGDAFDHLP